MATKREIPWLKRRSNGIWHAYWFDENSRQTRRDSMGTREAGEAQARYAAWLMERHRAQYAPVALTVRQALEDYVQEHVEPNTAAPERQRYAVANLMEHLGDQIITEVDQDAVDAYCGRRSCSSSTKRRELGVLRAALHHAARRKRVVKTDLHEVRLPPGGEPRDRWLTRDELARLFDESRVTRAHLNNGTWRLGEPERLCRTYRFVALAYYTGARRRSLEGLRWEQIDMERKRITLNPAGRAQTKKRRPVVPISDALLPILQRAWEEREGPFVLDHSGSIRTAFTNACERAGLAGVTPHTLRHTRAVHLAQSGADLYGIAGLLGDTLATVQKNYLHHCPEHLRAMVRGDVTPEEMRG